MSPLRALETWYARTCDGDWEHDYGITIETLDNPGWAVRIDLHDTTLSGRPFESVEIDRSSRDWVRCSVESNVFKGFGGATNLHEILDVFIRWAESRDESSRLPDDKVHAAG